MKRSLFFALWFLVLAVFGCGNDVEEQIDVLTQDLAEIKAEQQGLRQELNRVEAGQQGLQQGIEEMDQDLNAKVDALGNRVNHLETGEPPPPVSSCKEDTVIVGKFPSVSVSPGSFTPFKVEFPRTANAAKISGDFVSQGGDGLITVFIFDADNYRDWSDGRGGVPLFRSGRVTRGSINVDLPQPGIYYLVFSNLESTFLVRSVTADIVLTLDCP